MPIKYLNRNNNSTTILVGNSVLFNGSSQYLTIANDAALQLNTGNFTIEGWIYATAFQSSVSGNDLASICSKDGIQGSTYASYSVRCTNSGGVIKLKVDCNTSSGGGTTGAVTSTTTINTGTWYHFAYVRNGANAYLYINGTQEASAGIVDFYTTANPVYIGYENNAVSRFYWPGYISNFRIVKGAAVYTSNFTPSTSPLTAIANTSLLTCNAATIVDASSSISTSTGAFPIYNTTDSGLLKTGGTRTDTNSSSLVLAIPMDGANNGTTFTDESANIKGSGTAKTITNNGSIPTLTAISKFYGSSAYFSNASAQSIVFGNYGTDFQFTGDFTIECWVYPTTSGATDGSLFVLQSGGSNYFAFNFDPGTTFNIYNNSGGPSWSPSVSSVTTGQWNHFALIRSGNTQQVFVNGISIGTNTASGTLGYSSTSADFARIGGGASGAINSFIQDLRVYKGVAKYTANFTPPRNPNTITNNNSATVSSIVPFAVAAPAPSVMKFTNRFNAETVSAGTQKAIFGYGHNGTTGVSMTNIVSNTGVVANDTTGVGTGRSGLAAAGYSSDKAIFGYGQNPDNNVMFSMTNLVSNAGVVATDTTGVGTARNQIAAAGYGTDKAIFGYGNNAVVNQSVTNKVSNTGVVATDTAGVGTARGALAAAGYGSDKAIFGYGYNNLSMTNLISNTGVASNDITGVGTARYTLAAAGYGSDKAIFGYGVTSVAVSMTNLVSNTGVVATDTTGVGTARVWLAAAGYGSDKAIFGYGATSVAASMTNLVSNTGVVANDTTGVGTGRYWCAAAGFSAGTIPAPSVMKFTNRFTNAVVSIVTNGLVLNLDASNASSYPGSGTSWFDLSGNGNTGTLTNGPTFNSANGGSIVFDGTNDYVSSFPTQISGVGSKTVSAWIKINKTSRVGLAGIRDGSSQTGWVFTVNRTTYGNLTYFHTGGSTLEVAAGIITNTWYNVCVTYNLTSTTAILYLNGVQIGSPSTSFTAITPSSFKGVVGNEDSAFSDPFSGNIAQTLIYNRPLSASEVLQNYNITKAKFGL